MVAQTAKTSAEATENMAKNRAAGNEVAGSETGDEAAGNVVVENKDMQNTVAGNSVAGSEAENEAAGSAPTPEERRQRVFDWLDARGIRYSWYEHPEAPTISLARQYWRDDGSKHCKNLFFRNHKGDRHYLVSFDCEQNLAIHDLERRLRQGKLSFASEQRMERWLGLRSGSVSPFGLINDPAGHVHLFLDAHLRDWPAYSFHPNDNRATVVISREEFLRYLAATGNSYEFIELY